jgi:hypothetical protein
MSKNAVLVLLPVLLSLATDTAAVPGGAIMQAAQPEFAPATE